MIAVVVINADICA